MAGGDHKIEANAACPAAAAPDETSSVTFKLRMRIMDLVGLRCRARIQLGGLGEGLGLSQVRSQALCSVKPYLAYAVPQVSYACGVGKCLLQQRFDIVRVPDGIISGAADGPRDRRSG